MLKFKQHTTSQGHWECNGHSLPRLLILACTQSKRASPPRMAAIDRYDGPTFRVLRKFLRENDSADLSVYVISARFGLIHSGALIPFYDQLLTLDTAAKLRPSVNRKLRRLFAERHWAEIALCISRKYASVLAPETLSATSAHLSTLGGGLGPRLTALHRWLSADAATKKIRARRK